MTAAMSTSEPDTRTEPRQRALKAAKIVLNHEHSTIDCLIRNRAGHGAKLELKAVFVVPEFFEVLIDSDQVIPLPLSRCVPAGCISQAPMLDEAVNKMKKGSKAVYGFFLDKEVLVNVSLRGFTKAFNSLQPVQQR